jgi:hypothetical protein
MFQLPLCAMVVKNQTSRPFTQSGFVFVIFPIVFLLLSFALQAGLKTRKFLDHFGYFGIEAIDRHASHFAYFTSKKRFRLLLFPPLLPALRSIRRWSSRSAVPQPVKPLTDILGVEADDA